MDGLTGVHHLGLTVTDVERSARWYADVLDFVRTDHYEAPGGERRKIFLHHPGFGIRLGLVQHIRSSKRPFDETETGLDHLAFRVRSSADLESWAARFERAGVPHAGIAESNTIRGAQLIVFRDPDNIQLELFADPPALQPAHGA
jgi:glyoxylase I family protein